MRTSVNLRCADIPDLEAACEKSGKRHSELICLCLRKFFSSHPERLHLSLINRLVEYQPDGVGYVIVPIVFDVDVYNIAVNFRAFSRLSVSKMVTSALENFLEDVLQEMIENKVLLNYLGYYHTKRHNSTFGCPEWSIIWQVEEKGVRKRAEMKEN